MYSEVIGTMYLCDPMKEGTHFSPNQLEEVFNQNWQGVSQYDRMVSIRSYISKSRTVSHDIYLT